MIGDSVSNLRKILLKNFDKTIQKKDNIIKNGV